MAEIWVLGASGRSGRMIAAQLVARGHSPVLLGRDPARLAAVADRIAAEHGNRPRTRVMESVHTLAADLVDRRPGVVVNTIGPFTRTAVPIARACPPGTHYLDLANELPAVIGLLALHQQAVNGGRSIVPGAGFGVVAGESVVRALCEGRPVPQRVRVDAVPAVDIEAGPVGEALAATILDGFPAGGRRYEDGHLVDAPLGTGQERLVLPDGSIVTTAAIPFGDLEAAHRASGAPSVVSASSEAPTGRAMPYLLPVVARLLSWDSLRAFAIRRVAGIKLRPARARGSSPTPTPGSSGPRAQPGKDGCAPGRRAPSPPPPRPRSPSGWHEVRGGQVRTPRASSSGRSWPSTSGESSRLVRFCHERGHRAGCDHRTRAGGRQDHDS